MPLPQAVRSARPPTRTGGGRNEEALDELAAGYHVQDCSRPVCTIAYCVTRNVLGTLAGTLGQMAGDLEPAEHGPELTIIDTGGDF